VSLNDTHAAKSAGDKKTDEMTVRMVDLHPFWWTLLLGEKGVWKDHQGRWRALGATASRKCCFA
jgi:hypothetical protein